MVGQAKRKTPETTQQRQLTNNANNATNASRSGLLSLAIEWAQIPPTVAWPVISTA